MDQKHDIPQWTAASVLGEMAPPDDYSRKITDVYNRWAAEYHRAFLAGDLIDMSVAAFICNKLAIGIAGSTNEELKAYFYEHALRDDDFDAEITEQVEADDHS